MENIIEKAALNAWPAFESIKIDSWILRFAYGYTKRANSVTVLGDSSLNSRDKILTCEKQYTDRNLPTIFRLLSFTAPHSLDKTLEKRGYDRIDPTYVMQRSLANWQKNKISIAVENLNTWLDIFTTMSGKIIKQKESHLKILESIQSETIFCTYRYEGERVSCGLGVLENGIFGLFDFVTNKKHQRKGFATALIMGILDWAVEKGAKTAYLQVVQNNIQAVPLYKKTGFTELYDYWYRVKSL